MINDNILEDIWKEHLKSNSKEKWKFHSSMRNLSNRFNLPEKLFNLFKKYLKEFKSDGYKVLVAKKLSTDSLKALIVENSICAIHVPKFYPEDVADSLSKNALDEYTQWKLGGIVKTDIFFSGRR